MTELQRTPLYDWHVSQGGRMVDFAGWEMPVQYTGIVAEHTAVRTTAGVFDVSHMGRLFVDGSEAGSAIAAVVTCEVESLAIGRVRYGLVLDEQGGAIDDVLVTRLGSEEFLVVANASGRDAVLPLLAAACDGLSADVADRTNDVAMLAVQGPTAVDIVDAWFDGDVLPSSLGYYRAVELVTTFGLEMLVSRTGYTGEDGVELIFDASKAVDVADRLVTAGVIPAGLGARDTLRLEAGMPLYGHELTRAIDPITAGLGFAVRKSGGFVGADALASVEPTRARVAIAFDGKRPVREGALLFDGDAEIGVVTSGTVSPTLGQPIAMGYVAVGHEATGRAIEAEVRGQRCPGTVVALPFYRRAK